MKLRIRGNSIRLRLLRREVTEFGASGVFEENIDFGTSKLTYVLRRTSEIKELSAEFKDDKITIFVPSDAAQNWTETELITLAGEQKISNGVVLKILVEKQ